MEFISIVRILSWLFCFIKRRAIYIELVKNSDIDTVFCLISW